ncbi:protein of unknown function [Enhydrobacter aerosaccus]|uniref:DUF4440 domain-containing protein n=1 Tax=Enhydrobacter aerosaccus TaxID=225324 RepID=A0A1T4SRG6_9HYPH|nr:nuclear transport factor 2 family protein [Enhydrobacter aerosaccus]SKA30763.1 protein of unknown function [Enhydrobacter aerosaccus]
MTISRRHLAAAAFLASGAATLGATPTFAQSSPDTAAVAEAVIELTKAMLAADKSKLESLVVDQLSYGHSSGVVQDKATFVDVIASKKTIYKAINLSNQTVVIAGANAIVRHNWMGESGNGDGNWSVSKLGILQVWQKQGSNWKLLARQAFKV